MENVRSVIGWIEIISFEITNMSVAFEYDMLAANLNKVNSNICLKLFDSLTCADSSGQSSRMTISRFASFFNFKRLAFLADGSLIIAVNI